MNKGDTEDIAKLSLDFLGVREIADSVTDRLLAVLDMEEIAIDAERAADGRVHPEAHVRSIIAPEIVQRGLLFNLHFWPLPDSQFDWIVADFAEFPIEIVIRMGKKNFDVAECSSSPAG